MRVEKLELFAVDIPFRLSFQHAASQRDHSQSLFVKLTLDSGIVGWGEALPRPYVTGETVQTALAGLRAGLAPLLLGQEIKSSPDVYALVTKIGGTLLEGEQDGRIFFGAARCALEISLLDAASRQFGIGFCEWLGSPARQEIYATAVIPSVSLPKLRCLLWLIKAVGFRAVKLKVGMPQDEQALSLVRKILGPDIPLLVDANGAWQVDEAVEKLRQWKPFNICVAEQPVAARDIAGLRQVQDATGTAVMADESLRSLQDAQDLIDARACSYFNIRLSKCGGVISSWKILKLARLAGIRCQLGCQVGETSLLATAGRCFALCADDIAFYEGGYSWLLLKNDIAKPKLRLGWQGLVRGSAYHRGGLHCAVDESRMKPDVKESIVLENFLA